MGVCPICTDYIGVCVTYITQRIYSVTKPLHFTIMVNSVCQADTPISYKLLSNRYAGVPRLGGGVKPTRCYLLNQYSYQATKARLIGIIKAT
jgi:hypothetical protein